MKKLEYPLKFKVSKRAPSKSEMEWLNNWLDSQSWGEDLKVLEFGCGITTWVINNSLKPSKYYCVEDFKPCINQVKDHVKNVQFISTTWDDIPKEKYDLVFVDASSCAPKGLVSIIGEGEIVFRDDAIHYVMDFVSDDCFFIVHDWCYRSGWLRSKRYFEARNYKLIDSFKKEHGWGVYQKGNFVKS